EITTMSATSTVIRTMRSARAGDGISSSRRSSVAVMVNDRHRRCADAHELVAWMLERDANGKSLRDSYPVEVARDRRHAGDAEVLRLRDRRADALDDALQAHLGRGHDVRSRSLAGVDAFELCLAKIGDDVPLGGVDQGEQRTDGADELTDRGGDTDDA